jgi:hypothetical protein
LNRRKLFPLFAAIPAALLIPKISLPRNRVPDHIRDEIMREYRPEYGEAIEWNHGRGYEVSELESRVDGSLLETEPMRLASGYANFKTKEEWIAAMPHHLDYLQSRARQCLPVGYHYDIRVKVPQYYGLNLGVAWYNNPSINKLPLVKPTPYPGILDETGGYFLMGRFRV